MAGPARWSSPTQNSNRSPSRNRATPPAAIPPGTVRSARSMRAASPSRTCAVSAGCVSSRCVSDTKSAPSGLAMRAAGASTDVTGPRPSCRALAWATGTWSRLSGDPAYGFDHHQDGRDAAVPAAAARPHRGARRRGFHAAHHRAEGGIAVAVRVRVVQARIVHRVDEELRRGGIGDAGAGHRDGARVVLQPVAGLQRNRTAGGLLLHVLVETAPLDHEVRSEE